MRASLLRRAANMFNVPDGGSGSKVNQFLHVPTFVDTQHFIQIHPRVFE